jgi:peptidyl-prolyl cis-trans isomerase D
MTHSANTPASKGRVKRILSQLLLMFLVITFAVWGIGDIFRGDNSRNVAKVGDRYVSLAEFQGEMARTRDQARGQLPEALLNSPILRNQVVAKLVQDLLVDEAAGNIGILVGTNAVAHRLRRDPMFQNIRGEFDRANYEAFLRNQRISEATLTNNIARQLRAQHFISAYQLDQAQNYNALANLQAFSDAETRDILVVHVTKRSIDAIKTPDDATLKAAYADFNPLSSMLRAEYDRDIFSIPETRDISIMQISAKAINQAAITHVSDDLLRDYVHKNTPELTGDALKQALKTARKTLVSQAKTALLSTISDTLDDALAEGKTFDESISNLPVKATISQHKAITKHAKLTPADAVKNAFILDQGQSSALAITKDGGLYAIYIKSITPQVTKRPYDEAKANFKKIYMADQKARAIENVTGQIYMALQEAKTTDERLKLLKKFGVTYSILNDFGRKDYVRSGLPLPLYQRVFDANINALIQPGSFEAANMAKAHKYSFAQLLGIHAPKAAKVQTDEATKSLVSNVVQSITANALLHSFEAEIPVDLYEIPSQGPR